jgi:PHD/YefM family antitoxin component YafN of YafNO toxin-antitoxin module
MKNERRQMGSMSPVIHSMLDHLAQESVQLDQVNLWPKVRERLVQKETRSRPKGFYLRKPVLLPAMIVLLALVGVSVILFKNVNQVSAQQILDRAVAVQTPIDPSQSIEHIRKETINYANVLTGNSASSNYIKDSYYDYQNGRIRWVISDAKTGKISDAFSFDGVYTFSADQDWLANPTDDLLPIIRTLENEDGLIQVIRSNANTTAQELYEMSRNSENFELVGEKTWQDGRRVYVLRSPARGAEGADQSKGNSFVDILFFDAKTYRLLEDQQVIVKDGQDYLISSTIILIDDYLPLDSQIPWDLNDLQGVKFVDGVND